MEYKLYTSPWKAIRIMLLCSVFVVPSVLFLIYGDGTETWISWMCIGFFGLGYPAGAYVLFDRRPQIIVNEVGIYDRTVLKDFINWELIHDAYIGKINNACFIALVMKDNVDLTGIVNATAAGLNKALGFQELNINLSNVKVDEARLAQFIVAMSRADKQERRNHLKQLGSTL